MTVIHPDLLGILDAVVIHSPTSYAVCGQDRDVPVPSPAEGAAASLERQGTALVSALASALYQYLYTRPTASHVAPLSDAMARRDLLSALSFANASSGEWEAGWVVRNPDAEGRVTVAKDDLTLWAPSTRIRVRGGEIREGQPCRVWVGKEVRKRVPGFYVAIGDGGGDEDGGGEGDPLIRYYWHLSIAAAIPFMAAATKHLDAAGLPFRLKLPADPDAYRRADAGVLYVRRRYKRHLDGCIARIHEAVAPDLRPETPLFTKPLAEGLAIAEDPAGDLSFGEHRCKLVATALWRCFDRDESGHDDQVASLAAVFAEQNLDPLRPYLGPGSQDDYTPISASAGERSRISTVVHLREAASRTPRGRAIRDTPFDWLDAATEIGRTLARRAVWDSSRRLCNWIGRPSSRTDQHGSPAAPIWKALGPDLYGGSAGIALFLAQLHALIPEDGIRTVALAAIERSILQLDRSSSAQSACPLSLFLGDLGVAYAASRIDALFGRVGLEDQVLSIVDRALGTIDSCHPVDVIAGAAGAIPALLALAREPGLERCRGAAASVGDELCRRAIRRSHTCAWEPEIDAGAGKIASPLTGLSHGAAGIGLSLIELHAATGGLEYLETARDAFAYEDSLFDLTRGNWPDLRPSDRSPSSPNFPVAWCHGAPGIGLTRLRAARLDPARKDDYLSSARIAITTTLDRIDQQIEYPRADATLCHGLVGLIEILWIAGSTLDESSYRIRAVEAAQILIARHAAAGDWPSDTPSGGPNPSLMIGIAGIGYTFLRLHDPNRVPSILWIEC